MTPANASNPRMNETGPLAWPPVDSTSRLERRADRLLPVPEPYLNSRPSVLARSRMLAIESFTELMKQAEHCGVFSTPTLNHTGELNDTSWLTSMCVSSARKTSASCAVVKVASFTPQSVMVSATRPTSCRTECSRSGVPTPPRKYFETTTLVAIWVHSRGISQLS